MQSPQHPKSPESPRRSCFCGHLASPSRDNKYCSEKCAREDTEKMLMGEPSHYRNVSQAEVMDRFTQSKSLSRVAHKILVEGNVACDDEHEQWDRFKPLPPLPSSPQLPTPGALTDIECIPNLLKHEEMSPPQQPAKGLHSSVLAKRTQQTIV